MVVLPVQFLATKFDGYFWHSIDLELYSLKQQGVLIKLKHQTPNIFNNRKSGYQVSVRGEKRFLSDDYLESLQYKEHDDIIKICSRIKRIPKSYT